MLEPQGDSKNPELYTELSRLDEMWDSGATEIFEGEYIREEFQGVIDLNGMEYVQKKIPFKQGDVVELRLYIPLPMHL